MELYGVVSRGGSPNLFSCSSSIGPRNNINNNKNKVVVFCDNTHVDYYHHHKSMKEMRLRCGVGKKEDDVLMKTNKEKKKKVKFLLKGLEEKDTLSGLVGGFRMVADDVLLQDHHQQQQPKIISEATELLLGQLQQLKAEEMELKRKRKEEKARIKAARKQSKMGCFESSSSSSESSDSECGEAINTRCLKTETLAQPTQNVTTNPKTTLMLPSQLLTEPAVKIIEIQPPDFIQEGTAYNGVKVSVTTADLEEVTVTEVKQSPMSLSAKKIEVCLGGKCKKSGSAVLLEEFQKVVGGEGLVVGCKCMGKCKVGPNVRVHQHPGMEGSVCSGVGLEDVGVIVSNLYGGKAESDSGIAYSMIGTETS